MDKDELEVREKSLCLDIMKSDHEMSKKISELDLINMSQERIRRNIEVCVSVIKLHEGKLSEVAIKKTLELINALTV